MDAPKTPSRSLGFAVVGLEHPHAYAITLSLLDAGAELAGVHSPDEAAVGDFTSVFGDARGYGSQTDAIEDPEVDIIVPVGVPNERAATAVAAMHAGKDVMAAKPAVTNLDQLAALKAAQLETGRIFSIFLSERLESRATMRASELVTAGVIGDVVSVIGFGPHRLGLEQRPEWLFSEASSGGILADLATHQIDQFLHFAGVSDTEVTPVEIVSSSVANYAHPQHLDFADYGELHLRTATTSGFCRVDWYSPDGLASWGDVRLFLLGTAGYIELRKNLDVAGRDGGDHLILVDGSQTQRFECQDYPLTFMADFLEDVRERTDGHMTQQHCFNVCELALRAQVGAVRLGHLSGNDGSSSASGSQR